MEKCEDGCSQSLRLCPSSRCFLAQDEVGDAGDEGETDGDPGQDEGGSVAPETLVLMEDVRVDGRRDHNTQP